MTEKTLNAQLIEGKNLNKRLLKKMINRIKSIINSNKTDDIKATEIFDQYFELHHQTKLYWMKKNQTTR
jgi:hypothetical protein